MTNPFDKRARTIDENPRNREMAIKFSETLLTTLPVSSFWNVLDYGCGSGRIGIEICNHVKYLTMMDSSSGMLEVLRENISDKNISNMEIIQSEIADSNIDDESLDLIYLNNVLHHIEKIDDFLNILHKKIKGNGFICIGDIIKEDGTFHEDNSHVKHFGFSSEDISKHYTNNGFKPVDFKQYYVAKKVNNKEEMKDFPMFFSYAKKL